MNLTQPLLMGTTIHDQEVTVAPRTRGYRVVIDGQNHLQPFGTAVEALDVALALVPAHRRTTEASAHALASALAVIDVTSEALRAGAARMLDCMPIGGGEHDADTLARTIMLQAAEGLDALRGLPSLPTPELPGVTHTALARHLHLVDL